MRIKEKKEYTIGGHFMTAILYGDFSGMDDDEEIARVETFIDGIGKGCIEVVSDETHFSRCDITGMLSDCLNIEVTYFKEN
jgi:hypothetical protein